MLQKSILLISLLAVVVVVQAKRGRQLQENLRISENGPVDDSNATGVDPDPQEDMNATMTTDNTTEASNSTGMNMSDTNSTIEDELMDMPIMYNNSADSGNETLDDILEGAECDGGILFADPLNPVLQPPILPAYGMCIINSGDGSNVTGYARFTQLSFVGVQIDLNVTGLAPNTKHGFHLMQFGDMLSNGCYALAQHYNPLNMSHGGPFSCQRHLGDTGNFMSNENGTAIATLTRNQVSLIGPFSFLGKGCVVHSMADDYGLLGQESSTFNGHAGGRIGCGVIASSPIPGLDYQTLRFVDPSTLNGTNATSGISV